MRNEKDYLQIENFLNKYIDSIGSGNWVKLFKELIEKEPMDKVQLFAEFLILKAGINFLEGLNEIPAKLFANTYITEITIPSSIITIGESAFEGCKELKKVIMADTVSSVGENAFKNCIALEKVKMSNRINIINKGTFEGCKKLQLVSLPDELTNILLGAFKDCDQVKLLVKTDENNKANIHVSENEQDFYLKHMFGKKKAKPVTEPEVEEPKKELASAEVPAEESDEEPKEEVKEDLNTLTEAFDASMPNWLKGALMSQSYLGKYTDDEKEHKYAMFNKKGYGIKTPDMEYKNVSASEGNILTKLTNLGIDLSKAKFLRDGGLPTGGRAGIREKNGLNDNPPLVTGNLPFYLFKWSADNDKVYTDEFDIDDENVKSSRHKYFRTAEKPVNEIIAVYKLDANSSNWNKLEKDVDYKIDNLENGEIRLAKRLLSGEKVKIEYNVVSDKFNTLIWAKGLNDMERFLGPRPKNPSMCLYEVQRQDYPTLLADFVYLNLDDPDNYLANTVPEYRGKYDSLEVNSDTNRKKMRNPQSDDHHYEDEYIINNFNPTELKDKSGYLINPNKYTEPLAGYRAKRISNLMSDLANRINNIWDKLNTFNSTIKVNSKELDKSEIKKLISYSKEVTEKYFDLLDLYENLETEINEILAMPESDKAEKLEKNIAIVNFFGGTDIELALAMPNKTAKEKAKRDDTITKVFNGTNISDILAMPNDDTAEIIRRDNAIRMKFKSEFNKNQTENETYTELKAAIRDVETLLAKYRTVLTSWNIPEYDADEEF